MTGELGRPSAPQDTLIWAVGDVHGRMDLLGPLLETVLTDCAASGRTRRMLIFLGDYIDRGPASREVVDCLSGLDDGAVDCRFLRGNHEDALLAFLDDPAKGRIWCEHGGRETLRAYGVQPPRLRRDEAEWARASEQLNDALSPRHRAFLSGLTYSAAAGDYFFAHAGARPGVALVRQDPMDLMWIRHSFLNHPDPFAQVVVHGHTPTRSVHVDHRRIGIDTGAYATGVLTALRLEGDARAVAQTAAGPQGVTVSRRSLDHGAARSGPGDARGAS